jgi:hypothetical protein
MDAELIQLAAFFIFYGWISSKEMGGILYISGESTVF